MNSLLDRFRSSVPSHLLGMLGGALVTLSGAHAAPVPQGAAATDSVRSSSSVPRLATEELDVTFDPTYGLPASYKLKAVARRFGGISRQRITPQWRYDASPEFAAGCFKGDVHCATYEGSSLEYTFTGTGIAYAAMQTYRVGDEEIYIDGEKVATVNGFRAFADGIRYQQELYRKRDLPNGAHTLKIVKVNAAQFMFLDGFKVVHADGSETFVNNTDPAIRYSRVVEENTLEAVVRDPSQQKDIRAKLVLDSLTTVGEVTDATYHLEIPDPAAAGLDGTVNDDDGGVTYTGPWAYSAERDDGSYSKDSHFSRAPGSALEFTFDAYGIEFFGEQTPIDAAGRLSVRTGAGDYAEVAQFNQKGPAKMTRRGFASFLSLDKPKRTIKIEATSGNSVGFDFLRVYDHPTVVNDDDAAITYGDGTWSVSSGRDDHTHQADIHFTQTAGASVTYPFKGVGIGVVPVSDSQGGESDVYLDHTWVGTMNCSSRVPSVRRAAFVKTGLPDGPHTLKIVLKCGARLAIDAFMVIQKPQTPNTLLPAIQVGIVTIRSTKRPTGLAVALESVKERDGYQLIELHLRELVSMDHTGDHDWVAHGDGGGFLARLKTAPNCILNERLRYLPLVMFGNDQAAVSLEAQGYADNTYLSITGTGREKKVALGVIKRHRIKGSSRTPNPLISQKEICTIDLVTDYDRSGAVDWLDAAKAVKARMPRKPTDYFDHVFTHISLMQLGRESAKPVQMTFTQYEALVRRISLLVDGNPQMGCLAGWAIGGHDTTYPNYSGINQNLGGLEGWRSSKQRVMDQYNVNLTLDDNWDDQFLNPYTDRTSPTIGHYVDPRYARREFAYFDLNNIKIGLDGKPQRCPAVWNGTDLGYLTSFTTYMRDNGPGLERARYTIETYGLRDGVLIDAISHPYHGDLERSDFDPQAPASIYDELINKQKVFREYAKRGVHVASEYVSYPFVGTMTYAVDGPTGGGWNGFGGSAIPLMSLVYRNTLLYGAEGGGTLTYPDPKTWLFHNNRAGRWIARTNADSEIIGLYYMHYLPWMQLHDLDIQTFSRTGSRVDIGLEDNSHVWIDPGSGHFGATRRGIPIMEDYSVTIPMDANRLVFYAESDKTLSYPLPQGATANSLTAKRITSTEHTPHPVRVANGKVVVDVLKRVPVIVYLNTARDGSVRIISDGMNINYQGNWKVSKGVHISAGENAAAVLPFYGTGVAYLGSTGPGMGEADVYLDGTLIRTVNLNRVEAQAGRELFRSPPLEPGPHAIKIVKKGATGRISLDSFQIYSVPK